MMANFACLSAARHAVLAREGWDVNRRGLIGAPPGGSPGNRHDTIDLAVRYLGLGQEAMVEVDSDDQGRLRPDSLAALLDRGAGPVVMCLQAGRCTGGLRPLR